MEWYEVVSFYGEEIAERMKNSKYLKDAIVEVTKPDGKEPSKEDLKRGEVIYHFSDEDIYKAYLNVTGIQVHEG